MSTETEERDARETGTRYGLRMAEELWPLLLKAKSEDAIIRLITAMGENIEQHAQDLTERGLGYELAGIWMTAAREAATARLQAFMEAIQQFKR
jgi:hypothetical protein